jgi:hypothetical protein
MIRFLSLCFCLSALLSIVGCGESNPNSNIKPVPANAPKPVQAGAGADNTAAPPSKAVD